MVYLLESNWKNRERTDVRILVDDQFLVWLLAELIGRGELFKYLLACTRAELIKTVP